MPNPRLPPLFLAVLLLAAGAAGADRGGPAASNDEAGRPVLRHYTPGEHLRGTSSQRVFQDAAGFIYVANGVDMLAFDGVRWSPIDLPTESAGVRQFTATDDGTIFLAGAGVLGYLRGTGAEAKFVSLAGELPPTDRNIDELSGAAALGSTVYFADAEKLLVWHGGRFTVIPYASPPEAHGARLHRVGSDVYVTAVGRGLGRFRDGTLEIVSDDPAFRENKIITLAAGADGALLALTAERGFLQLGADARATPWPTEMNRWLAGKRVYCAKQLADGSWAIGLSAVSGDGGLRFDPTGRHVGPLDTTIGLVVKTVRDFFQDREGGLWLGMDTGTARLEWPSRVTVFDSFTGLGQGAVHDVVRHEGVLHAATDEGYFRLVPADGRGRCARFERVTGAAAAGVAALFRGVDPGANSAEAAQRLPHFALATIGAVSRWREEAGPGGPVLWVCGARGLARVEGGRAHIEPVPLSVRLSATGVGAGERLPTRHGALEFSFVAPRQRPTSPVAYQSRLVGLEDNWSEWSAKRTRGYAHLSAGDYRFEVRARDASGQMSLPAALAFAVLAPWWLTPWAFAAYAAAIGLLVVATVRWRTHALELRAAELEKTVETRTAELAEKNRELTRLHRLEMDEKIAARLGEEKARLEVLRYQLNPHFLFNTLASISASLPSGPSVGRSMVERLAEFCRLTLHRGEQDDWTTLGAEMRLLRSYLAIEQSRWGELLEVDFRPDPALDEERLPYFLLLPLVENALKYGQATSPDRVGLRLVTRRDRADGLEIEIANTGEWIEPAAQKSVATLGIGLENLRQRLARIYRHSYRLDFAVADGWVVARLRLPAAVGIAATQPL